MGCWLVVKPYPSEKYEFVNWDFLKFPTEWENMDIMFQSPPTSDPLVIEQFAMEKRWEITIFYRKTLENHNL